MRHEKIEPADELRAVLARTLKGVDAKECGAEPRRLFRAPGELAGNEAIFVRMGILALYRFDPGGDRHIVGLRFPGESIIPHGESAEYGLQAMTPARLSIVSDFDRQAARKPDLAWILWRAAQRNEKIAHEWLAMSARDARSRVAHLLCETAIRGGFGRERMLNPFTQLQIGEITGQTSVNVNRVLADLETLGLIERQNRDILFVNWGELARRASFRPGYLEADFAGL